MSDRRRWALPAGRNAEADAHALRATLVIEMDGPAYESAVGEDAPVVVVIAAVELRDEGLLYEQRAVLAIDTLSTNVANQLGVESGPAIRVYHGARKEGGDGNGN